jgi:hypothetical protein
MVNKQEIFKFKQLVEVCLDTKNYTKLAATTLMLLRSIVISHAYAFQIALKTDAYIYEMMIHLNRVLKLKSNISPYKEFIITRIKLIENLIKKGKGNIPLRYIKDAIILVFDLEQVILPSSEFAINTSSSMSSRKFFFGFNKSGNESPIQNLINHELSSRERSLRSRVESEGDENAIMELQRIADLKASLTNNTNKKVQINGLVSRDQRYLLFIAQSKSIPLLGIFFLLVTLSLLVLIQITLNFDLLAPLGPFFLIFAGGAALNIYLYSLAKRKAVNIP